MELYFTSHFDPVFQVFCIFVFTLCFALCIMHSGKERIWPTVFMNKQGGANKITDVTLLSFSSKNVEIHNRNVKTDMNETVYI